MAPSLLPIALLFSALTSGSALSFTNVTKVETVPLAFGIASANAGSEVFVPGSYGSSSGVLESFDGGVSYKMVDNVGVAVGAMILMTAAANDDGATPSVVTGGLLGVGISNDNGATFAPLDLAKVVVTQDVKYEKLTSKLYGVSGTFNGAAGVAVSSDGGASFTVKTIPSDLFVATLPRYASYPSSTTFYVTAGMWNDTSAGTSTTTGSRRHHAHHPSSRLSVAEDGSLHVHEVHQSAGDMAEDGAYPGWWGQVAKTTDGGETWALVFDDQTSGLYANDIHCSDENTCAFAMEGVGAPRIVSTTDGGATWNTFTDPSGAGMSLMAVRMTGPTEAWVAGGGNTGRVWHTTDLVNWEKYETASTDAISLISLAIGSDGKSAFATGVLRSQLCSVLTIAI